MTETIDHVLKADICVGCGGCAFALGAEMVLDEQGLFKPDVSETVLDHEDVSKMCPFLAPELNEDRLADRFLPVNPHRDYQIGKYHAVFAAHVEEGTYRQAGSSGGLGSWIATELLRKGLIDGVIHSQVAARNGGEDPFFRYGISRTVAEVRDAAHSHYHVVEISKVLRKVKETPGRYVFVGVPCLVKAVRRAQVSDPVIAERIVFCVGLVCGHLKSVHWALSLGWGAGTPPEDQKSITFRVKAANIPAKAYHFGIERVGNSKLEVHDSAPLPGGKFNLGAMMPNACNYCDDVVAETADLTIGDAWLPRYAYSPLGKNLVISRNSKLTELLNSAEAEGRVAVEALTSKEAADAQAGGFRQRREGLAYRLARQRRKGHWVPVKRDLPDMVQPGFMRAQIYKLRERISIESREFFVQALKRSDFSVYSESMDASFKRLRRLEIIVSASRILRLRLRAVLSRLKSR